MTGLLSSRKGQPTEAEVVMRVDVRMGAVGCLLDGAVPFDWTRQPQNRQVRGGWGRRPRRPQFSRAVTRNSGGSLA